MRKGERDGALVFVEYVEDRVVDDRNGPNVDTSYTGRCYFQFARILLKTVRIENDTERCNPDSL